MNNSRAVHFLEGVVGLLCIAFGLYSSIFANREDSRFIQISQSFGLFWIGILFIRQSLGNRNQENQKANGFSVPKARRIALSSSPKPHTPSSPIRVVNAHMTTEKPPEKRKKKLVKQIQQRSRGEAINPRPHVPTRQKSSESSINYNNESFVSTECSGDTPTADVSISSPQWRVPDSIAALWEPLDNSNNGLAMSGQIWYNRYPSSSYSTSYTPKPRYPVIGYD